MALTVGTFLSACGTTEPSASQGLPSALGDSPIVTGKIANLAEGNFSGNVLTIKMGRFSSGPIDVYAQGPVAADGSFAIQFPGKAEMTPRLFDVDSDAPREEGCNVQVTPASYKASTALDFVLYADGQVAGELLYTSDPNRNFVSYIYVDREVAIISSCTSGELTGLKSNIKMLEGWNTVVTAANASTLETRNEKPGPDYQWLFPFCTIGCAPGEL